MGKLVVFNALSGKFDLVQNLSSYVRGPSSATDTAIALYDSTTGKLIKNSVVLVGATGAMTGILTAVVGSTLTLSTGAISASVDLTISSTAASGNINLNPSLSGDLRSNQLKQRGVVHGELSSGSTVAFGCDELNFLYDSSAITLVIGWPTLNYTLEGSVKGARLLVQNNNPGSIIASYANIVADNTAAFGPTIDFIRARGTLTTPTVITAADQTLGLFRGIGHDGTDYARAAQIEFLSGGAFTASSSPGKIVFSVIKAGTTGTPSSVLQIGSDYTLSFLPSGATITNDTGVAVGSGFTQWNCDNLRLDGNTLSSTDTNGNIVLDPNGTGVIQLSANTQMAANALSFGASNEAAIAYSTNFIVNPAQSGTGWVFIGDGTTPDGIQAESIGLGDTSSTVSAVRVININTNSSGFSNGMFCAMTFSGATVTARAMNMTMTHAGGSASTATVANIFTATHTVEPTGTVTMQGVRGQASPGVACSTGTKLYHGAVGAAGISTGHTGGTIRSIGVYAVATTGAAGSATWTDWGILSEGDVQLNTGMKLLLEGSTTTKGDSYLVYNSGTTEIEIFVDNVLTHAFDNDESRCETKLATKAGTSTTYAKPGGSVSVNTTAVGNVGTGEDDLMTYSVPANMLATNGDRIVVRASGTFATSLNNKRLRARFGTSGTSLFFDTGSLAITVLTDWTFFGEIIRTGAATQKAYGFLNTSSGTLAAYADVEIGMDQTLSGTVTLKLTGEGTANDDVVQQTMVVEWFPAP